MKSTQFLFQALGFTSLCHAITMIYVSSYSGNITTVEVTPNGNRSVLLETIHMNPGCAPNPSWLTLDQHTSTLYCADEGLSTPTNATFSSFQTSPYRNGTISLLSRITTLNGGVYSKIYGSGNVLAIAH